MTVKWAVLQKAFGWILSRNGKCRIISLHAAYVREYASPILFIIHNCLNRESCGKCIGYLSLTRQETNPKGTSTNLVFQIPEDRLHLAANFVEKDFVVIGTFKEPCVGYAFIEEINVETGSFIKVAIDR